MSGHFDISIEDPVVGLPRELAPVRAPSAAVERVVRREPPAPGAHERVGNAVQVRGELPDEGVPLGHEEQVGDHPLGLEEVVELAQTHVFLPDPRRFLPSRVVRLGRCGEPAELRPVATCHPGHVLVVAREVNALDPVPNIKKLFFARSLMQALPSSSSSSSSSFYRYQVP
eukprot:CAMPEP_0172644208 /NCGR_PEP_ID=MMETSP1068-20121228/239093_1 /TAXON_ID=35684 /ORGANISM="Pseudopedinella elastica, Strain CCMP716" /LENGTH=170 /DNA_ID=CAMNT_0013458399 /DNA_START=893 /DNA_END=1406 /DNA_ORIENTATION=+